MRQLSLFKGPRQRGIAPPPPLEFEWQATLVDILKQFASRDWRWTHLPHGEVREHKINKQGKRWSPAGTRLKRMGVKPGWPDFIFCGPQRFVFWLELKREKRGRLSEDQEDVFGHLQACGFELAVVHTLDEAIGILKNLGVLPSRVNIGV